MNSVLLGFEVASGIPVEIPIGHMAVHYILSDDNPTRQFSVLRVGVEKVGAVKYLDNPEYIVARGEALTRICWIYSALRGYWIDSRLHWWQKLREPEGVRKLSSVMKYLAKTINE
jgi:hypothetical protein